MRFNFIPVLLLFAALITVNLHAGGKDTLTVAFWNVENLYNTVNDTLVDDEEFLPTSERKWDEAKFETKLDHLSSIVLSINAGTGPDFLGVAEIENYGILDRWNKEKFSSMQYGILHRESPDLRGIDVGLFYNAKRLKLLASGADTVALPENRKTRLILHGMFLVDNTDTLFVFVNHWPSRRGGQDESEKGRVAAAETLKNSILAVQKEFPGAKVICMGDFNDEPDNTAIVNTLGAADFDCPQSSGTFLNNLAASVKKQGIGSLKFRDQWNLIDQMMISPSLLSGKGLQYICNSFKVYKDERMIQKEGKYAGSPMPTFGGKNYLAGYSDHLPVYCKLVIK